MHPLVKAAGFTGSYGGGKALFDHASQRKEPIPVFAEMGSINPVFLLPGKLKAAPEEIATLYAASITLSVGQFCTNPGLLVALESDDLRRFLDLLSSQIRQVPPAPMLHPGIAKSFTEKRNQALAQKEVSTVAQAEKEGGVDDEGRAIIASATGQAFLNNPVLHQEVFGPYSLVIRCRNKEEMKQVALELEGQLTTTLMATADDIKEFAVLAEILQYKSGRYILNGVPTGVEVSLAMQHGGPFPATTDSRYSSVGADGIRRFARPLCYQNWLDALLPDELKDTNPLGIWRTVNNELTKNPINR
jgi:NADP-dependent aldehyde dehydrogenase